MIIQRAKDVERSCGRNETYDGAVIMIRLNMCTERNVVDERLRRQG